MNAPDSRLARRYLLLARTNRLANHRLDAACVGLSNDEWLAPRTGFFPSIAATLDHLLNVDRYYLDALEEGGVGLALFTEAKPCATAEQLAAGQRAVDLRWIAFCERLCQDGDAALEREVAFERARGRLFDRIDRTLEHVFMHATHHRGQAHAMLSGTSVAPPQLDEFLMATDAPFRERDLVATGLSEDDLAP